MAGILAVAQTAEISTGTTKKTVVQIIAASNHRVKVKEISISFKGVTNTGEPIQVDVERQTTAGSGGDSLTPQKLNNADDETLQTTAQKDVDGSTQPSGTIIMSEKVHPQGGYTWQAPYGGEIHVVGGARLGVAVTAAVSVGCVARVIFEE